MIPIDADHGEREAATDDFAAFVSNLQQSGMEPVVAVEPTSGGDVFIVTFGEGEPAQP